MSIQKNILRILLPVFVVVISCAAKHRDIATNGKNTGEVMAASAGNTSDNEDMNKYSQATFAAGCFWAESYIFESLKGVIKAVPGYAGGKTKKPTYDEVATGRTGHAESVNVYYDSSKISYPALLKMFFASQDPTQVNGQGPDEGTEYRSIVFYRNENEKQLAEQYINELNHSGKYQKPVATQILPYTVFWPAESYHMEYFERHPDEPYVQQEIVTRIQPFQKQYSNEIKPDKNLAK